MGQEQLSQKRGARGDHAVAFLPAGSAGIDGFPNAEQTVSQSFSPALNRLLYVHAAATDRAGLGRFAHDQRNRLHLVHLFAIALVQRSDDASQGLPCLERTWVVFFRWYWAQMVSICSGVTGCPTARNRCQTARASSSGC